MTMNEENSEASNFEIIFNTSPIGMFLINEYLLIDKINNTALEFFDLNREEALGKRFGNEIHCQGSIEDIQGCGYGIQCKSCQLRLGVVLALETGQATTRFEYQVLIHNEKKSKYWFLASISSLINSISVELGKGVGIKVLDHSMITSPQIKRWMAAVATEMNIPFQWDFKWV